LAIANVIAIVTMDCFLVALLLQKKAAAANISRVPWPHSWTA
jgi:hypothetical protein